MRLLFLHATVDENWLGSAWYKGDAPIWLDFAAAQTRGDPPDLNLPLRPPGAGFLVSALSDGSLETIVDLKTAWCFFGALTVLLVYLALLESFGRGIALFVSCWCAISTGLMILSTSTNNETPFLLLVMAAILLWPKLHQRPGWRTASAWGCLNALICLVRVEHTLWFALVTGASLILLTRNEKKPKPRQLATVVCCLSLAFVLTLLPWHLESWSVIADLNRIPPSPSAESEAFHRQVESSLPPLAWGPEALKMPEKVPAFVRKPTTVFVAATAAWRGRSRVEAEDFNVVEEAFGYFPEPLAEHPFIALYGGLNFALSNHEGSRGPFDRGMLRKPPPLVGGSAAYPPYLVQGLPPPDLVPIYPPHLDLINSGWSIGSTWIRENPLGFARLFVERCRVGWSGASLGFGGYGLPFGISGLRRLVDMVVPSSSWQVSSWRIGLLAVVLFGLVCGLTSTRRRAMIPWLLLLVTKIVANGIFFGYARHGATLTPVVALFVVIALDELIPAKASRPAAILALALLVSCLGLELRRFNSPPTITIDNRATTSGDPFPVWQYEIRKVDAR